MTAPNAAIRRAGQSLTPGNLVSLYVVDLQPITKSPQSFAFVSKAPKATGKVTFQGVDFYPVDIRVEGMSAGDSGGLPKPTLTISNVTRVMSAASILYQDLIGAKFTRIRTFEQFLDGGAAASTDAMYHTDVFLFDQKILHNKRVIKWRLASPMDQQGRQLPGRAMIREVCLWRYRRWVSGSTYDYSHVQCPYVGSQAYDKDGNPTTPDKDVPGRRLDNCCKVRFGVGAQLPFGGFPGINNVRV